MRSLPRLFLLLLTMAVPPVVSAQQSQTKPDEASKDTAVVAGTVVRLDTGESLKKAEVGLQSREHADYQYFQLTDEQGHFSFKNVPAGPYDLNVSRNGFVDAEYGQKKPGAPGAILTIEAGQHLTDLIFKLARAAAISGHVYDEDGEPVARAEVIAYRASKRAGNEHEEGGERSTNDLGEFRVFALAPGRYYIVANYRLQEHVQLDSEMAKQKFNPGYLPTYYPGTSDPTRAVAITVKPGDDISSVDVTLRTAHLVTVSGKVVSTINGVDCGGMSVQLEHRGAGLADAVQPFSEFLNNKGEFRVQDVPPGSYDLAAFCVDRQTHATRHVVRPLEVNDTDIENLLITVSRGTDISGHVTWEGGAPSGAGGAFLNLKSVDDQRYFLESRQEIKIDGAFQFKDVQEGGYRVALAEREQPGSYYLKSVRYGSAAVGSTGFTVQSGSDATLDVVISAHAAELTGVVLNSDSLPAVGATVVLVPEPPDRQVKSLYASTTTDQNGKFSITGITPGDYQVFSWDSVESSDEIYGEDWYDQEWLKPYEGRGQAVHLDEGGQKAINVTVIDTSSDSPAPN